ncbi:hypothetical protein ACFX1X_001412 [Malus domestica]
MSRKWYLRNDTLHDVLCFGLRKHTLRDEICSVAQGSIGQTCFSTSANCDPEAFYQLITNMANEPKTSHGLIFNAFEDLEGQALGTLHQEYYPNIPIFSLGPFHKCGPTTSSSSTSLLAQDQSCISWLNTQAPKSVAYVSFGSIAKIDQVQFLEVAWGLANSGQPCGWFDPD